MDIFLKILEDLGEEKDLEGGLCGYSGCLLGIAECFKDIEAIRRVRNIYEKKEMSKKSTSLPRGFPTHSNDINGERICLGDKVAYDFPDNTSSFAVVFEHNAFRVQYPGWDNTLTKPILEYGNAVKIMRLKKL